MISSHRKFMNRFIKYFSAAKSTKVGFYHCYCDCRQTQSFHNLFSTTAKKLIEFYKSGNPKKPETIGVQGPTLSKLHITGTVKPH